MQTLCGALNLNGDTEDCAKHIVKVVAENEFCTGRQPIGVCGAAILFVTQRSYEKRTLMEVAQACDMTEATIKENY